MTVAAVLVAAGSGERLGAGMPKALVPLQDRPILDWSVSAFADHPDVDELVVVAPAGSCASLSGTLPATVVPGGHTRSESVRRGLAALSGSAELVLIHDAARPLVPARVISEVIARLAAGADAVVPVLPLVDTVKRIGADGTVVGTADRDELRRVQTPQGFTLAVLRAAYAAAAGQDATDDAAIAELYGVAVHTVAGAEASLKITTPHDLRVAELLAAAR